MPFHANDLFPRLFTRKGLIKSPESMLHAQIIRRDMFKKQMDDGTGIRCFNITWLGLANGQIIPTVASAELLPLMDEVLDALKAFNG